ncbi:MAG: YcxB family protein [Streptosporangiales bacterium]|nr:YcxB family protein [Streptosporangiales bacterium]
MNEPIELRWTPEFRDSLQGTRVVAGMRLGLVVVSLVLIGFIELVLRQAGFAVLMFVMAPVFPLLHLLGAFLVFRRNAAGTTVDAVADEQGVRVVRAGTTTEYPWSTITEWREASRVFVLRAGGARSLVVVPLPKRALADEYRSELRSRLAAHVGPVGSRRAVQLPTSPQPVTTTPSPGAAPPDDGARVELRWTPERADLVEAMRAVSIVHRLIPWYALLVFLGGVAWSAASYHATPDGHAMNLAFIVAVPISIAVGSMSSVHARGMMRRNPLLAGEQRVRLDGAGLHVTVAGTETSADWTLYTGFRERRRTFVLRQGKSSLTPVVLLAKRGVVAPHTVEDVRAILERRLARKENAASAAPAS